ncbi:hypothetical protein FB107DRAFT_280318 [Schizophyllum commune]
MQDNHRHTAPYTPNFVRGQSSVVWSPTQVHLWFPYIYFVLLYLVPCEYICMIGLYFRCVLSIGIYQSEARRVRS